MTFDAFVDAFGAVGLAILGVFVLRLRPRSAANRAFGVFSIAFSLGFLYNLPSNTPLQFALKYGVSAGALLVAVAAVFAVCSTIPRPPTGRDRHVLVVLAGLVAVSAAVHLSREFSIYLPRVDAPSGPGSRSPRPSRSTTYWGSLSCSRSCSSRLACAPRATTVGRWMP